MLLKLVHYFVLLCYVNILAYEAGGNCYAADGNSILNGESILEFVLDDVLEIPIDKSTQDVEIPYDEYRSHSNQNLYILPVFIFVFGLIFGIKYLPNDRKHPFYDSEKNPIHLGYNSFLHRFKPF